MTPVHIHQTFPSQPQLRRMRQFAFSATVALKVSTTSAFAAWEFL